MLWLALHCPTLPLDCILRRWPEGLEPALAVTELDGTRRLIAAATRTAQARGVLVGQSIATSLSLLPDLVLVARKLEDERAALVEAALSVLRFTPIVSLRASGLVIEVSASLKLFGGRRLLKKEIAAAMRIQGLTIAAAEAPTPHGAWLLAQENARQRIQARTQGAPQPARQPALQPVPQPVPQARPPQDFLVALDALPVMHLESARPLLKRFDGIGVHTFADLRRLPVKGLTRRFGTALIDEMDRAAGDKPDPQDIFEAPSRFDTRIELMARVESAEALVFASQRLLAHMSGWLTTRRAAVRSFTLMLHHDRWTRDAIEPTAVTILLATPSSDLSRLETLVRERLSRLELEAPVLDLSLEAPAIVDEQEAHGTLFPEREKATETLARLFEKLAARLGPEAMSRLERVADHRPERAWREVRGDVLGQRVVASSTGAARAKVATRSQTAPASTSPSDDGANREPGAITPGCACGPRPAWLLSKPRQLEVREHRPVFESLPLELLAGPERIESGWWDDAPVTRDYFIAENATGWLVWVYRERLPSPGKALWYLQGLFG